MFGLNPLGEGLWPNWGRIWGMNSRGSTVWLAVALLVAAAPLASSQPLPSLPLVSPADDHTVVAVEVPLTGARGSGSLQVPVEGGILDIRVDPILLPGPGGTVDVEAYLAQVRLLLPTGVVVPLPSMVVRSEDRAIEGPAAQALADLAAELASLQAELETLPVLASEPDPGADPDPEPEPQQSDPVAENVSALMAQADALAAQAAWLQAMGDEAAGAAGAGVAEQGAIATAMLARIEAGLALLLDGLQLAQDKAAEVAESLPLPAPPEGPPASSSSSSSA
ncbi:MAG: hypothetical protein QOJ26_285, partial [Thermoplasmata archaeon]|nr:hypothetical protein [Thermoplasmata archaeon]